MKSCVFKKMIQKFWSYLNISHEVNFVTYVQEEKYYVIVREKDSLKEIWKSNLCSDKTELNFIISLLCFKWTKAYLFIDILKHVQNQTCDNFRFMWTCV